MKRRDLEITRHIKRYFSLMPWSKRGQSIIEYTVLFGIIAVVTAVATAAFFSRVCRTDTGTSALEQYSNAVNQRIITH